MTILVSGVLEVRLGFLGPYISHILTSFLNTAHNSVRCCLSAFSDRISNSRPPRSPDLKSSDSYSYSILKLKIYSDNSNIEYDLNENMQNVVFSFASIQSK